MHNSETSIAQQGKTGNQQRGKINGKNQEKLYIQKHQCAEMTLSHQLSNIRKQARPLLQLWS